MKKMLLSKICSAVSALAAEHNIELGQALEKVVVEEPRDPDHGHLATNAAMVLSKVFRQKPADLADRLMAGIDNGEGYIEKSEKAGPGFINFTLSLKWWAQALAELISAGDSFGLGESKGVKVMVEYVSANPTGPLHVGHGRGAAIGDALCRIMARAGYEVSAEYYINDAGRQMRILGESVFLRLKEMAGANGPFPEGFYQGHYIVDLANEYLKAKPDIMGLAREAAASGEDLASLAERRRDVFDDLSDFAQKRILTGIKDDLADFKVGHDVWFSEKSLYADGMVDKALNHMKEQGYIYEQEGALWFRSEALGDDKDRVLIKSGGEKTYFAADIAYHWNKYNRGFDLLVDIWGADHHGYVPRMKAAVEALGRGREQLAVLLVQLVSLIKQGQPVAMSTRAGEFVTLKEVVDEVGADAARFMFLTRSPDTTLEFDLDLAKAKTKDNPVYYVQYAGARIESILRASGADQSQGADLSLLDKAEEVALIKHLATFPDLVQSMALRREPHHLTNYLAVLARQFHHYYGIHRIAQDDKPELSRARLALVRAIRQVVRLGLDLLGVSSPDSM